jgi:hypothetical protein
MTGKTINQALATNKDQHQAGETFSLGEHKLTNKRNIKITVSFDFTFL